MYTNVTYEYVLKDHPQWRVYFNNLVDDRVHRQGGNIYTLRQYPLRYQRSDIIKLADLEPLRQTSVLSALEQETSKFNYLYSILETTRNRRIKGKDQLVIDYQIIAYIS